MNSTCVICGINQATTKEHIPPRCFFAKPRPQLKTVPACYECNNGNSTIDEAFKVLGNIMECSFDEAKSENFTKVTGSTLSRNKKVTNTILENSSPAYLMSQGKIQDHGFAFRDKDKVIHKILERTIKGLHFIHFKEILDSRYTIDVQWIEFEDSRITNEFNKLETHQIGDCNKFVYQCIKPKEGLSCWRFVIHRYYEFTGIASSPL